MNTAQVFDRHLLRLRRNRAALHFEKYDFLFRTIADRLMDRLTDVRRPFSCVLDLGAHLGALTHSLQQKFPQAQIVASELSEKMATYLRQQNIAAICADEEFLPFASSSFDLVISNLDLHWVNDLPGALAQVRQILKPDGLFLASIIGGDTLWELRQCLIQAEAELTGGSSPRTSPMIHLRDAAALLQRVGFHLPVADIDTLTITYDHPGKLLQDLRGMGGAYTGLSTHRRPLRRAVLMEVLHRYLKQFTGSDGKISTTVQVIYLAGWKVS